MEIEIRNSYKKKWCVPLFELPAVANCDYIPIHERRERIGSLFNSLVSGNNDTSSTIPLSKIINSLMNCGELYMTFPARKMYAGLMCSLKSKGRGNNINKEEFVILILELTHSATDELFLSLLKCIRIPWSEAECFLSSFEGLSEELFRLFIKFDKTNSGIVATSILRKAIILSDADFTTYSHPLSGVASSDVITPPLSLFGVTSQTSISFFKSILSYQDAVVCVLKCLSSSSLTTSTLSHQLNVDIQTFHKHYQSVWKEEEDKRFKPFSIKHRNADMKRDKNLQNEPATHLECQRCGDCCLCIDGKGELIVIEIAYCKKCKTLHGDWNKVSSSYAADQMVQSIDLHGTSMKAVEDRETNRIACISFDSPTVTESRIEKGKASTPVSRKKPEYSFMKKRQKRPATAKPEQVVRKQADNILIRCGECERVMLDMDSSGLPLQLTVDKRRAPIQCPGCGKSSTDWERVNIFDELQRIELIHPMSLSKQKPKLPTPPSEQNLSRRRSTPLIKCQKCGRNQLRIDQTGSPLPLSVNPYGSYSPLDCPGCNYRHTDWVLASIPLPDN